MANMAKLKKCMDCGRLFDDKKGYGLCSKCIEAIEGEEQNQSNQMTRTKEQLIKDCVYENPNIIPTEVMDIMDKKGIKVKYSEIIKLVNKGTLALVDRTRPLQT